MTTSRIRAAVAALALAPALLLGGGAAQAAAPAQQAHPDAASSARAQLLVYGQHDEGVFVGRYPQAARKLKGAPPDFVRFVARSVRQLRQDTGCTGAAVGLTVMRVRTDGFARGAVNQCGGYEALWKRVDGQWREIYGTQDIWTCPVLRRNDVPAAVIKPHNQCVTSESGGKVVTYRHR